MDQQQARLGFALTMQGYFVRKVSLSLKTSTKSRKPLH